MSNIRRQSIISSVIIYFGFALGFVNTYLFTKEGSFTASQYGVVSTFIAIANIMLSFANLGAPSVIYKFYPYYKDNLAHNKNDLITWALFTCTIGFLLVMVAGVVFKDIVIKKYVTNAPELIIYYNWLFPFGFGLTVYTVLEAYAWQEKKSVLTNFLREVLFRLFTTILIVLFFERIISSFEGFIKLYSLTYILLALILLIYLAATKRISFSFYFSRVTRKFRKKILALASFIWSGSLVYNISTVFDTLVIAAVMPQGMMWVGVYSLAQNITSLIQAPQRGVISAAIGPLSRAWKDKDYHKIRQVYQRSSINQLIFAVGMFSLILLNFTDGIYTFSLKDTYTQALPVFIFIGLMRVLDLGTGLNAQIIATSTYWKFEFFTGIILLSMALPLNYILTKTIGVTGPAISNLIAFTIYNLIRGIFLYRKLNMQPFTIKTLYTLIIGIVAFVLSYYLFNHRSGLEWIMIRSLCFLIIFGTGAIVLKLSPDIFQVLGNIKKRVSRRENN